MLLPMLALRPTRARAQDMRASPLYMQAGAPHASPDVVVTVNPDVPLMKSDLTLGITHTHYRWENGNSVAVARAKNLLKLLGGFQNSFIMSWGPGPIKTDTRGIPSNLDKSLTPRVTLVASLGEPVITFCSAPGWMKPSGTGNPDDPAGDWKPEEAPLPQYEDAYATLCAAIAKKYTSVKYFQVWNEFKGMWDQGRKQWDWERYTRFYNKIYKAVKAVRPDALIGGFYLGFGCDGSSEILGIKGHPDTVGMPFPDTIRRGMQYFLGNAAGMDFFCVVRHTIAWNNPRKGSFTDTQAMKLTPVWETFMREVIKELDKASKYKNVPIMYSEYYASLSGYLNRHDGSIGEVGGGAGVGQYAAAHYASMYNHILKGSSGRKTWMLLWMENDQSIPFNIIFTQTKDPDGGQPTPLYWVMMAYKNRFAHATLLKAESSSPDVEVIATRDAALLINKRNTRANININGKGVTLPAYGVALLDLAGH